MNGFPPPGAPLSHTVSDTTSLAVTVVFGAVAAALFVLAVVDRRRSQWPLLLPCLLAALVSVPVEPFVDLLGQVWFPPHDQIIAFRSLGIHLPLFVVAGYPYLFGFLPWALLRLLEGQPTRRQFWLTASLGFVVNATLQLPLLQTNTYLYYGVQPLQLAGYPVQWAIIDTGAALLNAAVLYRWRSFFTGARAFLAMAFFPCVQAGVLLGVGWPVFSVMRTGAPWWALQITGSVTIGLGLALYAAVAEMCCADGRWRVAPQVPGPRWMRSTTVPMPVAEAR
jgi:hypothetical protein